MVKLNLTGVSTNPEPMPKDTYPAKFTGHKVVLESKSSGQPYVNAEFTIDGGNMRQWAIVSLQQQSMWAFKRFAVALGIPAEEIEVDFDVDELLRKYYGTPVLLDVDVEEVTSQKTGEKYRRNTVTRVRDINSEVVSAAGASPF